MPPRAVGAPSCEDRLHAVVRRSRVHHTEVAGSRRIPSAAPSSTAAIASVPLHALDHRTDPPASSPTAYRQRQGTAADASSRRAHSKSAVTASMRLALGLQKTPARLPQCVKFAILLSEPLELLVDA